ncbi:MAG: vWA domain-containing protein [Planctomycetota bacterium]|jgi:Mg-chelatase subunit ChlD
MAGRKGLTLTAVAVLALTACGMCAETPAEKPRVEVAFVLDTTGSMSGLIEGAKAKIWYIANEILRGKPTPEVRMALVGFRDKGDQYVTRVFDLTDNIDQVYSDLMGFSAGGGGDTPEHVNKALHDAVNALSWSKDDKTLKVIYLVGDSPPHDEYTDTPKYAALAKAAITKGIYVNTILCGGNQQTAGIWREIARTAEGQYFAIAQDGGVSDIATPYDEELASLNSAFVGTVVVYGTAAQQAEGAHLNAVAASISKAPAAADRASFAMKTGKAGTNDLVAAVNEGAVKLADLDGELLPEEMRKMTSVEQAEHIAKRQAERDKLTKQISEVSAQRAQYIKEQIEKAGGAKDGFDAKVVEAIRQQGQRKNIAYE